MIDVGIIWDFDGAIGQINSTLPYNFNFQNLGKELENVKYIAEKAAAHDLKFTFAVTGFTAEEGIHPYTAPDLISQLYQEGHEIASHSWKHEWIPYLTEEQLKKSLRRSKKALEAATGVPGSVQGFVPPHNRPMTWRKKGRISLGDRPAGNLVFRKDIDYLTKILKAEGYSWARVSYTRSFIERISRKKDFQKYQHINGIHAYPNMYVGFDEGARKLLMECIRSNKNLVLSGHPLALEYSDTEKREHFDRFMPFLSELVREGKIRIVKISDIKP